MKHKSRCTKPENRELSRLIQCEIKHKEIKVPKRVHIDMDIHIWLTYLPLIGFAHGRTQSSQMMAAYITNQEQCAQWIIGVTLFLNGRYQNRWLHQLTTHWPLRDVTIIYKMWYSNHCVDCDLDQFLCNCWHANNPGTTLIINLYSIIQRNGQFPRHVRYC